MVLLCLDFLGLNRSYSNSKIGTDEFTETTVNTLVTASDICRMIPFTIELGRFL